MMWDVAMGEISSWAIVSKTSERQVWVLVDREHDTEVDIDITIINSF
jgi:hypothetical protein